MGLQRVDKHFSSLLPPVLFCSHQAGEAHGVDLFSPQFFVDFVPWQAQICLHISSFPFPKYGLTKIEFC